MPDVVPVNSLEIQLRAIMKDPDMPSWNFYTPLAASPLWLIIKHYPELDGSGLVAPKGQHPEVCFFKGPEDTCVGLYTAECRVEEAFKIMKLSRTLFTYTSAPGYQLLKFLQGMEFDCIWMNAGIKEFQYCLDGDMVDILLSQPEPDYENRPTSQLRRRRAAQLRDAGHESGRGALPAVLYRGVDHAREVN